MNCSENKPPAKRLIFDISPFRTTVVLAESGRACEVYTEDSSERKLVGSIYKGVVQSILPGLSAAFVNIGQHKNAILHFCDIRVDRSKQGEQVFTAERRNGCLGGAEGGFGDNGSDLKRTDRHQGAEAHYGHNPSGAYACPDTRFKPRLHE